MAVIETETSSTKVATNSQKTAKNKKKKMKKKEKKDFIKEIEKKKLEMKKKVEEEEVPLTRYESEDEVEVDSEADSDREIEAENKKEAKTGKKSWTNKQRILILGSRGIGHRDRHLMDDIRTLLPHSKPDSKFARGRNESNFAVNELAEMKNCNKALLFEGRKGRPDLYMWAANVARGPSAKFLVENIHTMGELKMTGNCLKASRPFLSFDKTFEEEPHYAVIRELFTQIFSIPNQHPKSQPFFDHVFTFSVVDDKIWFRNFQILEEDGALAEVGPRFVMNPIKVFDSSFSGATLWDNPKYITPTARRTMLKRAKAGKYQQSVQQKAAYAASRPTDSTYKVDATEDVFANADEDEEKEDEREIARPLKKRKRPTTAERKKSKKSKDMARENIAEESEDEKMGEKTTSEPAEEKEKDDDDDVEEENVKEGGGGGGEEEEDWEDMDE